MNIYANNNKLSNVAFFQDITKIKNGSYQSGMACVTYAHINHETLKREKSATSKVIR